MYTLVAEKPHFFGAYSFKAMLTWQYNDYSQWFNEYADNLTITTAHTAETTIKHTKPRRRIAYSGVRLCAWTAEKPYFKRFSGIEKVHRNSIKITVDLWRRARDSNPRNAFDVYTISNRAPSTSSDNSPYLQSNARILYMTAPQKSSLFSKILNFLFLHSPLIE